MPKPSRKLALLRSVPLFSVLTAKELSLIEMLVDDIEIASGTGSPRRVSTVWNWPS